LRSLAVIIVSVGLAEHSYGYGKPTDTMITASDLNAMLDTVWSKASVTCLEVTPTVAVAQIIPEERHLRPGGYISGPTQFAVADSALWFLVAGALGRVEPMALTSELSIRFLRPAVGERLFGRARLERAGRRSVVGTVSVWTDGNEDRISATAQGTYALPDP
ncbi:MAG: PaaI family thioesterase, partial [Myxococcota bacterium]